MIIVDRHGSDHRRTRRARAPAATSDPAPGDSARQRPDRVDGVRSHATGHHAPTCCEPSRTGWMTPSAGPRAPRPPPRPVFRPPGCTARSWCEPQAQLRLFADVLLDGDYAGVALDNTGSSDPAQPGVAALARAGRTCLDLRGRATSRSRSACSAGTPRRPWPSALPVVVKAHPSHPTLSVALAELAAAVVAESGLPVGTFAVVVGDTQGTAALRDSRIKASGFTGSTRGGRALFGHSSQPRRSDSVLRRTRQHQSGDRDACGGGSTREPESPRGSSSRWCWGRDSSARNPVCCSFPPGTN